MGYEMKFVSESDEILIQKELLHDEIRSFGTNYSHLPHIPNKLWIVIVNCLHSQYETFYKDFSELKEKYGKFELHEKEVTSHHNMSWTNHKKSHAMFYIWKKTEMRISYNSLPSN